MTRFENDTMNTFPSEDAIPGVFGYFEASEFFDRPGAGAGTPRSSWDERALVQIERHLQSERSVIEAYETMRSEATGAVAYLIDLVLADEKRHHHMFAELANAVGSPLGRVQREAEPVPSPSAMDDDQRERLLSETHRFLDVERDDKRALHEMQKELRPSRTNTIWPLLVELMELDTEKHIKVLHRVEQLLGG